MEPNDLGPRHPLAPGETPAALAHLSSLVAALPASAEPPDVLSDGIGVIRDAFPQARSVTLSLFDERGWRTVAATDRIGASIDERQYRLGEGPCLHASRMGETFIVSFVCESAHRWPDLSRFALSKGVRSALSAGLPFGRGSLNVYSSDPQAFGSEAERMAAIFATYAATLERCAEMHARYRGKARLAEQLQRALETRPTIDQAKGILMAQRRCSPDEAFSALVAASRRENVKVSEIARRVVEGVRR